MKLSWAALPKEVLSEMLEETRQKVLGTSERITALVMELEESNAKVTEMQAEFDRIVSWSEIFDESDIEVRKMICGFIIKRVTVRRDYDLEVEFNITVEQFLKGIDSISCEKKA